MLTNTDREKRDEQGMSSIYSHESVCSYCFAGFLSQFTLSHAHLIQVMGQGEV